MHVDRVKAVFFSPTGATCRVAETLAGQLAERFAVPWESIPFTLPQQREREFHFEQADLVVFAVPTYAGKLPNKILPFIKEGFKGNGAQAAAVVTFGNRSYDNALAELVSCLRADGFSVTGGGAFVTRHCFSKTIAAGRPDEQDLAVLHAFGEAVCKKISASEQTDSLEVPGDADAPYYRPRGRDGEPVSILKVRPVTDPVKCDRCILCAKACPMGSIDMQDPLTVRGICIKCQACVLLCPKEAKYFDDPQFLSHQEMLERSFTERKEPEWFV